MLSTFRRVMGSFTGDAAETGNKVITYYTDLFNQYTPPPNMDLLQVFEKRSHRQDEW